MHSLKVLLNVLLLNKILLVLQLVFLVEEKYHFVQPLLPSLVELQTKLELLVLVEIQLN
jgi:hypothetical protein